MGLESSKSALALVGMHGFCLLAAIEVHGELHKLVETIATVVGCPSCGTRAVSKGRSNVPVRGLAAGGRRVVVLWRKRRLRGPDPDCDTGSWTERSAEIAP